MAGKEVSKMVKRAKVSVLHQTKTGLNDRVSINGKPYSNVQAYDRARKGKVPGYNGATTADGTKYIRSNPDHSKKNNLE